MSIGLGIAIASVWMFAAAAFLSKELTATGMWVVMAVASAVTLCLI